MTEPPRLIRVLLVDDDPNILRLLQFNLELEDFEVSTMETGDGVLERARSGAYDLIVLDQMLPGIEGSEVLERLRADAATAELPVVMLTARTAQESVDQAYELGANAYIKKPFDAARLGALLREVLEP